MIGKGRLSPYRSASTYQRPQRRFSLTIPKELLGNGGSAGSTCQSSTSPTTILGVSVYGHSHFDARGIPIRRDEAFLENLRMPTYAKNPPYFNGVHYCKFSSLVISHCPFWLFKVRMLSNSSRSYALGPQLCGGVRTPLPAETQRVDATSITGHYRQMKLAKK